MNKYASSKSCKILLLRKVPKTARFHTFDILWKLAPRQIPRMIYYRSEYRAHFCCYLLIPRGFCQISSRLVQAFRKSLVKARLNKAKQNPVRTARDILKSCVDGVDSLFELLSRPCGLQTHSSRSATLSKDLRTRALP